MKRGLKGTRSLAVISAVAAFILVSSGLSYASNLTIPNTFVQDTPASASEVNTNFSATETAVDDNYSKIVTNQNTLSGMPKLKQYETGGGQYISSSSSSSYLLSLSVNAPVSGYVIVYASGSLYNSVSTASNQMFRIKVSQTPNDINETPGIQFLRYQASAGYYSSPYSIVKVFTVTKGYNYFYLNIWHQLGSGYATSRLDDTTFTALFVPGTM